jgi:hypothetical protein
MLFRTFKMIGAERSQLDLRPTICVRSRAPRQRSRCKGRVTPKSWSECAVSERQHAKFEENLQ